MILPYTFILKTIWWMKVILWIIDQCDTKDWPFKIYVVSDLYFMVWWFCLISWRLFDGEILYLGYWISVTQRLASLNRCGSVTYISWSSNFALYLEDYLIDGHTWYNGSVWHKGWPHKIYIGEWPIFHGPVILPYISKTIWWMKVILDIMDQCDTKIDHIKYI